MNETKIALVGGSGDGESRELLSPAVGRYLDPPSPGTHLEPASGAGWIRILGRTFRIVVPDGVRGIVAEVLAPAPRFVEYGLPLLRVARRAAEDPGEDAAVAGGAEGAAEGIPDGMLAVRSPTDGIFYRRPAPDEPAYVDEGEVIETGRVLGLVEVMKCFNQIVWRPAGAAPAKATVAKVLGRDSAEVRLGEPLFLLEPV